MASRSFHDLFLRARDQFAGSGRFTYLAALVLALLHLAIVTPFVESRRLASETSSERGRLAVVERSAGELEGALEAIRDETSSALAPALERLVEDLELDLARLDATRRQYAPDEAAEAADDGAEEGTAEGTATEMVPEVDTEDTGAAPFLIDDPDRIADLRDAESRDELLDALALLAEELIFRPRYFDLERGWKDEALPRLMARLDVAAGAVPRLRGRFPEARVEWESLAGALAAVGRSAKELRLEPPAAPFWWVLPASGEEIELGLTGEVADEIRRPRPLADLESQASRVLERHAAVAARIAEAKRELGELPAAGTLGGIEVAGFAAAFPLLIGLLLGGAAIWRSQRLRELGLTTRLAIEHGGPPELRRWLWTQAQWSSGAGRSATAAWRACVIQTLSGYFVAMAWIAVAAVQLRRIELPGSPLGPQRLMIVTLAGAAVVLLAVVHRLMVSRRAILSLADIGDEGVAATAEDEAVEARPIDREIDVGLEIGNDRDEEPTPGPELDTELIDVHTLRR